MGIWVVVGVAALLFVLFVVNANRKIIKIAEPELGLLNLIGPSIESMVHEDRNTIRPSFYVVKESTAEVPLCDVLLLYATIHSDGSLEGTDRSLRDLIADSSAKIVVVASENPSQHYTAALKRPGDGRANIVLTVERRGWIFAAFLSRLFETMAKGLSMPVAWVRIAPQRSGAQHKNCPSTIFLCEFGRVAFKRQA